MVEDRFEGRSKAEILNRKVLERSSPGKPWNEVLDEWYVDGLEVDPDCEGVCECTHTGLAELYVLKNRVTGLVLFPIGSECINRFNDSRLDNEMKHSRAIAHLIRVYEENEWAPLPVGSRESAAQGKVSYFTRAYIKWLYEDGAFDPCWEGQQEWGVWSSEHAFEFMRDMFNRQLPMTDKQRWRADFIQRTRVIPFLQAKKARDVSA